ncbi:MAG: hypothetical protein PHY54_03710 [Methylococcales bacterium]|nr:hypothetical protein [Methylococcales bacterium]
MAFRWLSLVALCFGLLGSVSDWTKLPENLSLLAAFGTISFGLMALAELFVQCVEHIAEKLSHKSNYYWAAFILLAMVTANQRDDLINYLLLFFVVLMLRWVIAGSVQALSASKSHST